MPKEAVRMLLPTIRKQLQVSNREQGVILAARNDLEITDPLTIRLFNHALSIE